MSEKRLKNFAFCTIQLAEGADQNYEWVQYIRTGEFAHPDAPEGLLVVDKEFIINLEANYNANVRRLDTGEIAVDYSHKDEEKAAGWIKEVKQENDGQELWIRVDWTKTALKMIQEKEFRFLSPDLHLAYTDNESGRNFGPTILGAGLTNRPHIKGMRAIFEEKTILINKGVKMEEELKKQIAELKAKLATLEAQLVEKTKASEDVEKKMSEMETKLSEAHANLKKATEEKEIQKKEMKFNELLTAGKILPAQKDAFLKMDVALAEDFFKDAKVLNMSEAGHGTEKKPLPTEKDVEEEVAEKTVALMEVTKGLKFSEAMNKVFEKEPELAKKYHEKIKGE